MQVEQLKVWKHHKHLVVAIVADEPGAVAAVRRLHRLGLRNDQLSMLALDTERLHEAAEALGRHEGRAPGTASSCDQVADDTRSGGWSEAEGMAVGSCVGLVLGLATFALPGVGATLLAAGPVVQAINVVGHMLWSGVGLGMVVGALFDERVSEDARDRFARSLEQGRWLLIVHGDDPLIERAAAAVRGEHVERVEVF